MLKAKNILIGITGGIAAYKIAGLIRLLIKEGADVKVVMTPMAKKFITPLTIATLSKNPILVDFYNPENGDWNSHVDIGEWADAFIIAPATANTMGKMANAIADNLLITTYLSAKCPVFVAPAMDLDMYLHPANQNNINILKSFGNTIIEPTEGELASGLVGKGRMEEPENILNAVKDFFEKKNCLLNHKILVTAGPSYEKIDAVRFIGNHSSGKMGYSIAKELADRGADVTLLSGPVNQKINHKNIKLENVYSADDMYKFAVQNFKKYDIAVMAAAVSDYTPVDKSSSKLKRKSENLSIELKPTKDIAAKLGSLKTKNQLLAGFALETDNSESNALKKLIKKNLDFIILNSITEQNQCFNSDFNKITIFDNKNNKSEFDIKQKALVAKDIADYILMKINALKIKQ